MVKRLGILALVAGTLAFASDRAEGSYITGVLEMTGLTRPVIPMTDASTTVGTATGLDFVNLNNTDADAAFSVAGSHNGQFETSQFISTGTFSDPRLLSNDSVGTMHDVAFFGSGNTSYPTPPIAGFQLIAGNGFHFDLATILIATQSHRFLNLVGWGTMFLTGFDPTPGALSITLTDASGERNDLFSSLATDAALPEPDSMILLGVGLIALGAVVRRRRRQNI